MQIHQKKQTTPQAAPSAVPAVQHPAGPPMDALRAGAAQPTAGMLGHKVDLPGQMQAKMESAFGADLSGVQLYESQAVADAGAQAITQGNRIAFAPGQLDFASMQGQALLGHELSHVVSQARGEVSGGGFLSDHALEARADREGFLAAQGESVSGGVAAPLSSVSAAGAAGPMQAKKPKKDKGAAPAQAAPAPAPAPAETFTPQQQNIAAASLQHERDVIKEGRSAYEAALARYNAANPNNPYNYDGGNSNNFRYLNRHLVGKSEAEQDAMFQAFATDNRAAMAPYLAQDIRNFNQLNYNALDSSDDTEVARAYGQFASISQDNMSVSDFTKGAKPLFSAKDLGLSEEEMEEYNRRKLDLGSSLGDARMTTKAMASGSSETSLDESRSKRTMRFLDRKHAAGELNDDSYRMMIAPYLKFKRQ